MLSCEIFEVIKLQNCRISLPLHSWAILHLCLLKQLTSSLPVLWHTIHQTSFYLLTMSGQRKSTMVWFLYKKLFCSLYVEVCISLIVFSLEFLPLKILLGDYQNSAAAVSTGNPFKYLTMLLVSHLFEESLPEFRSWSKNKTKQKKQCKPKICCVWTLHMVSIPIGLIFWFSRILG